MAEEVPVVQNWRTLIIAGVLGLVVVVIYNYHMHLVREAEHGDTVVLLQVDRHLNAGDSLKSVGQDGKSSGGEHHGPRKDGGRPPSEGDPAAKGMP